MPSPPGHPAHQLRPFTLTVRHDTCTHHATVLAQTRTDAIFRAGVLLGAATATTPPDWIVIGVTDPAETVWTPPAGQPNGEYMRLSTAEPDLHEHRLAGQILTHQHPGGSRPHGYYGHPEDNLPDVPGAVAAWAADARVSATEFMALPLDKRRAILDRAAAATQDGAAQ